MVFTFLQAQKNPLSQAPLQILLVRLLRLVLLLLKSHWYKALACSASLVLLANPQPHLPGRAAPDNASTSSAALPEQSVQPPLPV